MVKAEVGGTKMFLW